MSYLQMENEGDEILQGLLSKFLRPGMKIVEVGCGSSDLIEKLERKYKIKGICVDPYGYGKKIVKIAAENIDDIGEKFDLIYLIRTLHHLNVDYFSKSAYLSLKKGGKMIIVDWKKGANTGVSERYFSLKEILALFRDFHVIEKGEGMWNFYLVLEKV